MPFVYTVDTAVRATSCILGNCFLIGLEILGVTFGERKTDFQLYSFETIVASDRRQQNVENFMGKWNESLVESDAGELVVDLPPSHFADDRDVHAPVVLRIDFEVLESNPAYLFVEPDPFHPLRSYRTSVFNTLAALCLVLLLFSLLFVNDFTVLVAVTVLSERVVVLFLLTSMRGTDMYTYCGVSGGRLLFPCVDLLNVRCPFRLEITVPARLPVSRAGRTVSIPTLVIGALLC